MKDILGVVGIYFPILYQGDHTIFTIFYNGPPAVKYLEYTQSASQPYFALDPPQNDLRI